MYSYSLNITTGAAYTVQVSHTSFTSNTALEIGGGLRVYSYSPNITTRAVYTIQISHTSFTNNRAEQGGAVRIGVDSPILKLQGLLAIWIDNCTFSQHTIGFSVMRIEIYTSDPNIQRNIEQNYEISYDRPGIISNSETTKSFVSGNWTGIAVLCDQLTFTNNNIHPQNSETHKLSGMIHLVSEYAVYLIVVNSIFVNNSALSGAAITVELENCIGYSKDVNYPLFHITNSSFSHNQNYTMLLSSNPKCASIQVVIANSSFTNNTSEDFRFGAEDIYSNLNTDILGVNIAKAKQNQASISATGATALEDVVLVILAHLDESVISVVSLAQYSKDSRLPSLFVQCPKHFMATVTFGALNAAGISLFTLSCTACTSGYYSESYLIDTFITVDEHYNETGLTCQNKKATSWPYTFHYKFCYTSLTALCHPCPYGANCTASLLTFSNYWGQLTDAGQLEVLRCPTDYCCDQAPCSGLQQCAPHHGGTLCGQCETNYTEALLTNECIPNEHCHSTVILVVFPFSLILFSIGLILKDDIKGIFSKKEEEPEICMIPPSHDLARTKVLHGFITLQKRIDGSTAGITKYLQIIFFTFQDASIIQIDLAVLESESFADKLRKLCFAISHLAVEALDWGFKLCGVKEWSPVLKVVFTNLLGPSVFCFFAFVFLFAKLLGYLKPSWRTGIQNFLFPRMVSATISCFLFFFQKISSTALSLVHCVTLGDQSILFLDGTVTCYQTWHVPVWLFIMCWVMPFFFALTVTPGILEAKRISTTELILCIVVPVLSLPYLAAKGLMKKLQIQAAGETESEKKVVDSLLKSYKNIYLLNRWPICWTGIIKARRLILVFLSVFISNLVLRILLIIILTMVSLFLHLNVSPYQDNSANVLFTVSQVFTLLLAVCNGVKAVMIQYLVDTNQDKATTHLVDTSINVLTVFLPVFLASVLSLVLGLQKVKKWVEKKCHSENEPDEDPVDVEVDVELVSFRNIQPNEII